MKIEENREKRFKQRKEWKRNFFGCYATWLKLDGTYMLSQTSSYKSQCISKYSLESFFLLEGNSAIRFSYWNDDAEKFKWCRKNGGFDYIPSPMKVFLRNEYNSSIHTARNAKVTSTKIVYEKTLMKRKVFRGVFRTHSNIYDKAFLKR